MQFSRRRFLQSTLGSSALLSVGLDVPAFLARTARAADGQKNSGEKVLVVVQLSGGNDGLNTVIPYQDPEYNRHRITLKFGENDVLKIDSQMGLHPRMNGFAKLLKEGRLGILQGIGYPNPDRSHFRSMDIWHTARPEVEDTTDGWLGRCVNCLPGEAGRDVPGVHLGPGPLPLALVSQKVAIPSVESFEGFRLSTDGGAVPLASLSKLAQSSRPSSPLLDFLQRSTLNAYASSEQVQQALADEKSAAEYPESGLGRKLKGIAQLIDAGLSTKIYYVSLDGFDTHSNQAEAHAALLNELAEGMSAFIGDLATRGHLDRVLVLSFSEFGRRVHENASQGTDHGAAAPVFVAGGKVQNGLVGQHPSLTDLDGEGDLKFHTDFRQIYATILDQWLGCASQEVLGKRFEPVAFLKA